MAVDIWIPAFAGMTRQRSGMTGQRSGMTGQRSGMTGQIMRAAAQPIPKP